MTGADIKPKFLFNLIKGILFITFSLMFLLLMDDVWSKFTSKMTSTGVTFEGESETKKQLPYFTFCPWPVYRNKGFHFSKEDFKKNTFEKEDLFHPYFLANIRNGSKTTIKEVWSIHYGRCFTLIIKVTRTLR